MKARLQKMGDGLVLRIPEPFARQIGLEPNSPVELSLRGRKLVIEPVSASDLNLDDLLARVTKDNIHGEVETGPPAGREVW